MYVLIMSAVVMGSVSCGLSYQYSPASFYNSFSGVSALPPLFIMADSPYSVARTTTEVPLLIVSGDSLRTIHDARISSVSPTQPLVTCQTSKYTTEAAPAVQVLLRRPIYINSRQSTIPFPSVVTVVYDGLRMAIPVGAVVAPVPEHSFRSPHLVRVVYALPAGPLPFHYPYYETYGAYQPVLPEVPYVPFMPLRPGFDQTHTVFPGGHQHTSNYVTDIKAPSPPGPVTVTVLEFPTAVATPEALYYRPSVDSDSELGNRSPPEAVVPAGIVQSTAPQPNLSLFLNSKESPLLQVLREESKQNKEKVDTSNKGVESL